ncbi:MAG: phage head closure protein [Armatimonadetes bacterium]|nr:phage head closure protein [Armatimonadota bacterium]
MPRCRVILNPTGGRGAALKVWASVLDGCDLGEEVEVWTTFATVWAKRQDLKGRERFTARQRLALRTATYRIRWLGGLEEKMRVLDEGSTFEVVGIAGERRQGWLELSCEALNPATTGSS